MKLAQICIILCVMLSACQNGKNPTSVVTDLHKPSLVSDSIFNMGIINELNDSLFSELLMHPVNRYVLVYFDADCSGCITLFLNLLDKVSINDKIRYLYIGNTSQDLQMVEHYLDQMERQLNWNEYLLPDTSGFYSMYNPSIGIDELPLVIIDSQFNVVGALSLFDIDDAKFFSVLDELLKDDEQ